MGVRAKRSHAGPAVRGGAISFAAGRGSWGLGHGRKRGQLAPIGQMGQLVHITGYMPGVN
jgi:hypothetical protein